jgi:hypothetical protein
MSSFGILVLFVAVPLFSIVIVFAQSLSLVSEQHSALMNVFDGLGEKKNDA